MRLLTGTHRREYEDLLREATIAKLLRDLLAQVTKDRDRERERADTATDALLAIRGIAPISPLPTQPAEEDILAEDPDAVAEDARAIAQHGILTILTPGGKG